MKKSTIYFIAAVLIFLAPCAFSQNIAEQVFPPVGSSGGSVGELSLYGGVSSSQDNAVLFDQNAGFGGSGAILGVTAVGYAAKQIALGVDISFADNGAGSAVNYWLGEYALETQHIVPMFFAKIHLLPADGRVRVYIPLGVGVDVTTVYTKINGQQDSSRTQAGIALAGGLGAEVAFNNGTFVGVEGRYNYANYFGSKFDGLSNCGVINVLFKVGIRFDGDAFLG